MKKMYFLAVLLFGITTAQANVTSNQIEASEDGLINRYRYAQPITFVERGVEFFIFPNGEFDFNTHPIRYNRTSRRSSVNVTYGAPRVRGRRYATRSYGNVGVRIKHDRYGRVRSIGNLFVNYDRHGRVKRIGSIYMGYSLRLGKLKRVGGLTIKYNRWGRIVRQFGNVKPVSGCGVCGINNCTINHGHSNIDDLFDGHNDIDDDDDVYYYRKNELQKKKKDD